MTEAVFNTMAICGAAAFAGVMLCIGMTVGGYWRTLAPVDFLAWFGEHHTLPARPVPLVVAPMLIGFAGSCWLDRADSSLWLWLTGLGMGVGSLIATAAYFVPANTRFRSATIDPLAVPTALDQWLRFHRVRIALALGAAIVGSLAA